MHLDEEQLQRFLHGELAPWAAGLVREHLAGCLDCRDRVAAAQREENEVSAQLRQVDHLPPPVDARVVIARAQARDFGWVRWAAGILLLIGAAGAAYAVPGSPVPGWTQRVVDRVRGHPEPIPAPSQASERAVAGIAVAPGQNLIIVFASPQADGQANVLLNDGAEVVVRALTGAATFTSDIDRLVIDNRGSVATFEIQIPRDAPHVEIRIGSRRTFLKEGLRITTETPTDTPGPYVLPLTSGGS